jgi:hypothetical protein
MFWVSEPTDPSRPAAVAVSSTVDAPGVLSALAFQTPKGLFVAADLGGDSFEAVT